MMRVGLMQFDHVAQPLREAAGGDYPEMFSAWLRRGAPDWSLEAFDFTTGQRPPAADCVDLWLTTGSAHSVYDEIPWIAEAEAFVRDIREAGVPYVGICFGHQLLATALGGKVAPALRGWGLGVGTVRVDPSRRPHWMQPARDEYRLLFSHQDQVEKLPPGAVVVAGNEHCPVSAFVVGESMVGFQGHPEFTHHYARTLMLSRTDRIPADVIEQALSSLELPDDGPLILDWIRVLVESQAARS